MLRFSLFGFPVAVHGSFGFLVLFLAYGSASTMLQRGPHWVQLVNG